MIKTDDMSNLITQNLGARKLIRCWLNCAQGFRDRLTTVLIEQT